jgi:outer membrane protein
MLVSRRVQLTEVTRRRELRICLAAAVALCLASPARAKEPVGWQAGEVVLKLGSGAILFNSSARIKVAGNDVPGGNAKLSDGVTATGELEYFPTRNLSVAAIFGIPLNSTGRGAGTLSSLGELGRVKYGIGGLVARYHVNASRRFSPFAAVGIGRFLSFSTQDGAVSGLKIDSAWGPVLQGGADYHFNRRFGLYFNASYVPLKTDARGTVGGPPATARVTANPVAIQGGVSYRF